MEIQCFHLMYVKVLIRKKKKGSCYIVEPQKVKFKLQNNTVSKRVTQIV